jgi:NADH-quinone oxidoreductase subunit E
VDVWTFSLHAARLYTIYSFAAAEKRSSGELEVYMGHTETSVSSTDAILEKYGRNPNKLIPILQEVQAACQYLPEDVMAHIARQLGIPASTVYGVATFYAHFTLEPKGRHVIKICDGTACHVKKSEGILKALESSLGLGGKNKTTKDMMFTLETVACLGACGLAPVVVVDDKVYGLMTPEKTLALLETIRNEEGAHV